MFGDYVLRYTAAKYNNRILILDDDKLETKLHYSKSFIKNGFEVIYYKDDLDFRVSYEDKLKASEEKMTVIAESRMYIPYDILKRLYTYSLALGDLFPKLNIEVLREHPYINMDLLCLAYEKNYENLISRRQTESFIEKDVFSKENVMQYGTEFLKILLSKAIKAKTYKEWIEIAENKAKIDVLAAEYRLSLDTSEVNRLFKDYVLMNFGKLSSEIDNDTPVLVSHAMEYMHDNSEKFVIVVMDGMSEFDWHILSKRFSGIDYEQSAVFAMIPSTTSISRQCLLSNKLPCQLMEPWKQSKEEAEFKSCAKQMGYKDIQIAYGRGYDVEFEPFVRCGAVIINDIDDMVHSQKQGRIGMFNDISVLAEREKLIKTVMRLIKQGFDVYITADHGNTPCRGLGRLIGTGVEVETKGHRMLVLQDFADKNEITKKYDLIEYPKYYLDNKFDYLICDVGDSFDIKGDDVMSHGGISIDEIIVPFIKVKAGNNNG